MTQHQEPREFEGAHERSDGEDGREWTLPVTYAPMMTPYRLFVRATPGELVELIEGRATSHNQGARLLEDSTKNASILLNDEQIAWLLEVLPQALALRNRGNEER